MRDVKGNTLRLATKGDVLAIRALTRAAYAKWVPVIGREPVPMTADYTLAIRIHRFDLLEAEKGLIALVETIARPDHIWVENLAISPEHHGRGLGRMMLGEVERIARSLGQPEIRLLTNREFEGNVEFYERAGFTVEREEPFRGCTTAYLAKSLT